MIDVEYARARTPHKCMRCGYRIKLGATYVRLLDASWDRFAVIGRFCDPLCAREHVRKLRAQQETDRAAAELLRSIVLEDEK